MEPMTLGSPSGSPLPSTSGYLPSFLMGDTPATPRANTLSPTKGRSSLAFAQSPTGGVHTQSSEFGNRTAGIPQKFSLGANLNQSGINHNTSVSGPPTQGLFDSLRNEKQIFHTPNKNFAQNQHQNLAGPGTSGPTSPVYNDSYLNQSGFNVSKVMSPIPVARDQDFTRNASIVSPLSQSYINLSQAHVGNDYWITVFGFPQTASSMVLSHFSQCGSIIDKAFATQNGNWVHLRFTSRLECDKALNYNGKIIGQNLMIGVQYCNDPAIVGKENSDERKE